MTLPSLSLRASRPQHWLQMRLPQGQDTALARHVEHGMVVEVLEERTELHASIKRLDGDGLKCDVETVAVQNEGVVCI